mgnify:CR=1 FL=1
MLRYAINMTKKRMMIQVDEFERKKIEQLAVELGMSFSGVVRRIIREYKVDTK